MTAIVLDPTIPHEKEYDYSHCPKCGAEADALDWHESEFADADGYSQQLTCTACRTGLRLYHQALAVEMFENGESLPPWPDPDSFAGQMLEYWLKCNRAEYTDTGEMWEVITSWYRGETGRDLETDGAAVRSREVSDFDYGQITHEQMEHALAEFIGTTDKSSLCAIPGVREIILEEENNTLLDIARQRIEEAS